MAQEQGTVEATRRDDTVTFWVAGRATMLHGLAIRGFAEQCLQDVPRNFRVDLRRCTYMDSTFQGTLLYLRRETDKVGCTLQLVYPSNACRRLLDQIGADRIFEIVEGESADAEPGPEAIELTVDERDTRHPRFRGTVVEAHQELARLSGPQAAVFRALAERLSKDFDSPQPHASAGGPRG